MVLSMVEVREKALAVLDSLRESRKRSRKLLTKFSGPEWNAWTFETSWAFCVGSWARGSLDISKDYRVVGHYWPKPDKGRPKGFFGEVWTQGRDFDFDVGTVFYDVLEGYVLPWGKAVPKVRRALQIMDQASGTYNVQILARQDKALHPVKRVNATGEQIVRALIAGIPEDWVTPGEWPPEDSDTEEAMGGDTKGLKCEFIGICKGILADGKINLAEADYLRRWIEGHKECVDEGAARDIQPRLNGFLQDGRLAVEEEKELFVLLHKILGEDTPLCAPPPPVSRFNMPAASGSGRKPASRIFDQDIPAITFVGRIFCLTGLFLFGSREECAQAILQRGGRVSPRVTRKLDYLVVGDEASPAWIGGAYGRKIEEAMKLRKTTGKPCIVPESLWSAFLGAFT